MNRIEIPIRFIVAAAATFFLFLSGLAIPLAGILMIPLVPQPSLAFGVKYGRGPAFAILFTVSLLLFLFGGKEVTVGFLLLALMVVLFFYFFGRGWPIAGVVVGTATGMFVALSTLLLAIFGSLSQLREVTGNALRENLDISLKIYEKAGFSPETIELARERSPQIIDLILQIMPALAFMSFATVILINLVLLSYRFPQYRTFFYSLGDPKEWRSPEPVIWCFILSAFCLFLPANWGLHTLALNVLLIVSPFYFFQGLAIVAYFFHHKKVPRFLRGIGYVLIALEQLVTLAIVGLGLFDLWGDFRKLKKGNLNQDHASEQDS